MLRQLAVSQDIIDGYTQSFNDNEVAYKEVILRALLEIPSLEAVETLIYRLYCSIRDYNGAYSGLIIDDLVTSAYVAAQDVLIQSYHKEVSIPIKIAFLRAIEKFVSEQARQVILESVFYGDV